jgi:Zn-dependent protease
MPTGNRGSIHLFRLAGVDLYLHWSWFLVAFYEIQSRDGRYSTIWWSIFEYLALFGIVLTHEFGHAMACRSVGGQANQILLWPFGGVAYVRPPQRPGATLWSIAAGPLVNVALLPVLWIALKMGGTLGWADTMPDAYVFLYRVFWYIDVGLLVFNILPVYPLDGGQIFRSLLWFVMGRGRSLMVATVVGFLGIAALLALAVHEESLWTGAICIFLGVNCWNGLQRARVLLKMEKLPRRDGYACPSCRLAPLLGAYWKCDQCKQGFDTFATGAVCPNCAHEQAATICLDCSEVHPISDWAAQAYAGAGVVSASFEAK